MTRYPAVSTAGSTVQVGFSRLRGGLIFTQSLVKLSIHYPLITTFARSSHERPRRIYELGDDV